MVQGCILAGGDQGSHPLDPGTRELQVRTNPLYQDTRELQVRTNPLF